METRVWSEVPACFFPRAPKEPHLILRLLHDMSEPDASSTSLKSLWDKAERQRKALASLADFRSDAYKIALSDAIATASTCKDLINNLSLFSTNETLEDVATNELKYMLADAYRGELLLKQHDQSGRLAALHAARTAYRSFLSLCDAYDLLGAYEKKAYKASSSLSATAFDDLHANAGARREAKIARYQQEKELKAKLEHLSRKTQSINVDDEEIRALHLSQIQLATMQALQQLEGINLEIDILGKAPSGDELHAIRQQREEDDRSRRRKPDDNYSDRVDPSEIFRKANGRPLLSSDGKPLRPFTLLQNREMVKGQVFGPGHRLPTVTIDEYLEETRKQGGIIEGGGEQSGRQPEPDEDNMDLADQETYKAREWDEFKEANPNTPRLYSSYRPATCPSDVAAPGDSPPQDHKPVVERALECMVAINPSLRLIESHKVVYNWPKKEDKVALISGGGSGHEPAHAGFVGDGMLDVAVAGDIFASPSTAQILVGLRTIDSSKGGEGMLTWGVYWGSTLMIVKNYTGDMLNFGAAAQKRRAQGHDVAVVIVNEDASLDGGSMVGRRGLAGTVFVHKIAGAAAARGDSLAEVGEVAQRVVDRMATVGVSLGRCSVPGRTGEEGLQSGEIEFGMGIHNEPGVLRTNLESLSSTVSKLLDYLFSPTSPLPKTDSKSVAVMVNNLGGLSTLELHVTAHEVLRQLDTRVTVVRRFVGTFMTSLDGPGFSVTLLNLDDNLLPLLDEPTAAPAWPKSLPVDTTPIADRISNHTDVRDDGPSQSPHPHLSVPNNVDLANLTTALLSRIRAEEPLLTKLDTVLGDGDCGTTLLKAATAVHASFQSPSNNTTDTPAVIWRIAEAVDGSMGGTSGALYSIFLHALSTSLQSTPSSSSLRAAFATALGASLDELCKYTRARTGDRTLMDALIPFVTTFESTNGDMAASVAAARRGCEGTAKMEARAGRASYVKAGVEGTESGVIDPGAKGLLCILEPPVEELEAAIRLVHRRHMSRLVDAQERQPLRALDLTNALAALRHIEIPERRLVELLLALPFQGFRPGMVAEPVADKVRVAGINQHGDLLEQIRHEAMVRLHPITREEEVAVDVEVAGIVLGHLRAEGVDYALLVQVAGDPAEVRVAQVRGILARAADIVHVRARALVRSHHRVVAVDGRGHAAPHALAVVAVGDEVRAARVCVLHVLAFRVVQHGGVSALAAGHRLVVFVLREAIGEAVADQYRFQIDVALLVGEDLVGKDGDVVARVGFTRDVEGLGGVFGELLEEEREERVDVFTGRDGVGDGGAGVGVADVDGLVEEDDGGVVVPGGRVVFEGAVLRDGGGAEFHEEAREGGAARAAVEPEDDGVLVVLVVVEVPAVLLHAGVDTKLAGINLLPAQPIRRQLVVGLAALARDADRLAVDVVVPVVVRPALVGLRLGGDGNLVEFPRQHVLDLRPELARRGGQLLEMLGDAVHDRRQR
ncbi:Dihydroxyacetone kinase [Drechslerella dactyloides]|uniref:Dihydroxyacetone kinase n=1 Tax=Drechslerella dactyloides TaxID=74499 RepID=A0AAD6NK84_DREDA|nr:Dihydroxyacetone kinase [Drechslerella dactyloides]